MNRVLFYVNVENVHVLEVFMAQFSRNNVHKGGLRCVKCIEFNFMLMYILHYV